MDATIQAQIGRQDYFTDEEIQDNSLIIGRTRDRFLPMRKLKTTLSLSGSRKTLFAIICVKPPTRPAVLVATVDDAMFLTNAIRFLGFSRMANCTSIFCITVLNVNTRTLQNSFPGHLEISHIYFACYHSSQWTLGATK